MKTNWFKAVTGSLLNKGSVNLNNIDQWKNLQLALNRVANSSNFQVFYSKQTWTEFDNEGFKEHIWKTSLDDIDIATSDIRISAERCIETSKFCFYIRIGAARVSFTPVEKLFYGNWILKKDAHWSEIQDKYEISYPTQEDKKESPLKYKYHNEIQYNFAVRDFVFVNNGTDHKIFMPVWNQYINGPLYEAYDPFRYIELFEFLNKNKEKRFNEPLAFIKRKVGGNLINSSPFESSDQRTKDYFWNELQAFRKGKSLF